MKMVIIGGGKVGYNLARIMLERRHTVSLVERDRQRCERAGGRFGCGDLPGDGTNVTVLEAAGTQDADVFMTVTGSDQDNLVACQVARDHFHAKKVISRVNDPRNIETFRVLGIRNTACSTEILTKMIEQEADLAHMHLIATPEPGQGGDLLHDLAHGYLWMEWLLKDIDLPGGTLVDLFDPPGSAHHPQRLYNSAGRGMSWWRSVRTGARRQLMRALSATLP